MTGDHFSQHARFERAVRHLVLLADRKGWSPRIRGFSVRLRYRTHVVELEIQASGRVAIRRFAGGELATSSETDDLDQGLMLTERLMEEMVR